VLLASGSAYQRRPEQEGESFVGIKRKLLAIAVAMTALGSAGIAASGTASASAYGCTGYGTGISWQGVYVKNGTWCGGVNGSGTHINYISGNFYTHVLLNSVCNFSMKADFYDVNGNWYGWRTTGVQYRCSYASDLPSISMNQNVRAGKVRISLVSNGSTVAAVYESIHP